MFGQCARPQGNLMKRLRHQRVLRNIFLVNPVNPFILFKRLLNEQACKMTKALSSVAIFLLLTIQSASAIRQNGSKLVLNDCQPSGVQIKAKCGTYEVYENRAAKKGRKISLNILLVPATSEKREPDPIVYFAGGP